MGRAESFNEYAMIRSALEETARKIQAREESIERQRELLLAEEDTVKRGKMMEKIDRERRAVERERKSLKALEEKAERTALQTRTGRRLKGRAQRKGILKTGRKPNQLLNLKEWKPEPRKRAGRKKTGKPPAVNWKERKLKRLKRRRRKKRTNLLKEKPKRKGIKTVKRVKNQAQREE